MELYILNSDFVPTEIIDDYESLIWSERFYEIGDIELIFPWGSPSIDKIHNGTWLGMDLTDRIMRVDTIEHARSDEGDRTVVVKGESVEAILKRRVYWRSAGDTTLNEYSRNGSIVNIIRNTIRKGGLLPASGNHTPLVSTIVVPNAVETNLYPDDNLTDPGSTRVVTDSPMPMYDFIHELCEKYNVGIRMYRNRENPDGLLYVNVYLGSDRTLSQSSLRPIVFGPDLQNVRDQNVMETSRNATIGVWVWDSEGSRTAVFYPTYGPVATAEGLDLGIDILNIDAPEDSTASEREAYRLSQGKEHLNTHQPEVIIDGEITATCTYLYGRDYFLGDRVQISTDRGHSAQMRVTEQIFVSDTEGTRNYPTLSNETVVLQDSWLSQPTDLVWQDAQGTWAEQG